MDKKLTLAQSHRYEGPAGYQEIVEAMLKGLGVRMECVSVSENFCSTSVVFELSEPLVTTVIRALTRLGFKK